MHKLLPILHVLSKLIMLFAGLYVVPAIVSIIYQDGTLDEFLVSMFVGMAIGLLLWAVTRRYEAELKPRDGFMLVSSLWIGFAATATTPFLLHFPALGFTSAFFEAMSGLTTTGATVLSGLDHLPPAINFWRHFLNWLGGMGIIVLAVAVLPLLGIGGMQLYKAETPGPMKDSKLSPRITHTAKNLWFAYALLTAACVVALRLAGMDWFDAVCHAFAALSLGGFSTHDASVGYFNSVPIEVVLSFFMLLAAMNFATHFLAIRDRSIRHYIRDSEAKSMLALIAISILAVSGYLTWMGVYDFTDALRHVSFNLISIATDSGFASTDFSVWPVAAPLWMLLLSCITACAGSTGGGIKMGRTLVLAKQSNGEMVKLLHPNAVVPVKIRDRVIPSNVVQSVLAFIFVYAASIVLFTFVLMVSGLDFLSSFTAVIACINNAGPGLGVVGPAENYSALSNFQIWVCSLVMLLGRLEIFTLLILLSPAFWRK